MTPNDDSGQLVPPVQSRSRGYLVYLVVFLGSIALMDGYLSSVKSSAIPYILKEYGIDAPTFSGLESLVLISTFFIFLLNHLADVIGRKLGLLLLILGFGLTSLAIALWTPTLPLFMLFYAAATFFTVSNMWQVPGSEEAPAPGAHHDDHRGHRRAATASDPAADPGGADGPRLALDVRCAVPVLAPGAGAVAVHARDRPLRGRQSAAP
ncbi:MAG: hypothetical protein R2844_12085 [Caldilineales bacterium]